MEEEQTPTVVGNITLGGRFTTGRRTSKDSTTKQPIYSSHFTLGRTTKDSTKQPILYPTPQIQNLSIKLNVSLKMLLQKVTKFAGEWKDVNRKYDDRRSFPTFLWYLQMCGGMDWHRYIPPEDNGMDVIMNQPYGWPAVASDDDGVQLRPELTSNSDWVMANKYFDRSLSLMRLLQRIQKQSPDEFSRKQAELLEDFLGHLIKIQQEHRAVARSFSGHLEELRKESNAVDEDGDRHKYFCAPVLYHMRQQSRLLVGLYFVSRELTWLLRKLENSRFSSPSFIEESHKILEITVDFMSKFKKYQEALDLFSVPGCDRNREDPMMQFVQDNKEILDDFGNRIKGLQAEDVGKGSVIENLLDCLGHACNCPYARYPSMDDSGEENISSTLDSEFIKAVTETSGLIKEARKKLNSDKIYTLPGSSSLGNIVLWRILFESSLADLRFDLIRKMQAKAVKLGAEMLRSKTTLSGSVEEHLNRLRGEISLLLSDGDRVLLDYVAMHRTVAEITYMLGDVFTTGGAGMNDLSDEAGIKVDSDLEFPWDKHNVPDFIKCCQHWQ